MKSKISFPRLFRLRILALMIGLCGTLSAQTVQTFVYTGAAQTFTVPPCVATVTINCRGASGVAGTSAGGLGGIAQGVLSVTSGQVLQINVGGTAGFNGGAAGVSPGGNGGGASDVRTVPFSLADRQIVAGGGGGGGATNPSAPGGAGGGGTPVGSNFVGGGGGIGANNQGPPVGGQPGATNGGAGGVGNGSNNGGAGGGGGLLSGGGGGTNSSYITGNPGTLGNGGAGGNATGPGGGGGGYYGGGGASGGTNSNAGGGGGSSWTGTLTSPSFTAGTVTTNGQVTISYVQNGTSVLVAGTPSYVCTAGTTTLVASNVSTYTWLPSNSNATFITVTPPATTVYTVTGTNNTGCVTTATVMVVVNSTPPVLTVNQSTTNICPTNTVVLTASGANGYTWTSGVQNGIAFSPLTTSGYTVNANNGCGSATGSATITVTPLPVFAIVTPTLICANETATLNAGGALNYSWAPGTQTGSSIIVTPTAPTVYTVVGTTSICAGINTVTLAVSPIPTITAAASATSICQKDPVTLTATGGLSYTWQPINQTGATIVTNPSVSTSYVVTGINSFSCTSNANVIVVALSGPTVTAITNKPLACIGSSVNLIATGANTYVWTGAGTGSNVIVNPSANTVYTVTGTYTSNGCSNTATVSVGVLTPTLAVSPATNVCVGGSVTISASGASNYTWAPGQNSSFYVVSPAITTTYTVSAVTTTAGQNCPVSNSVLVTVNPLPPVTAAASRTSACKNESVTMTAGGATSYTWSNFSNLASFQMKLTSAVTLTMTVTGVDNNGCENTATAVIKVSACTGMENIESNTSGFFEMYPNPSTGDVFMVAQSITVVRIFGSDGKLVKQLTLEAKDPVKGKLEDLSNGIYLVKAESNGKTVNRTLIIEK
jgi:hypothetical protein